MMFAPKGREWKGRWQNLEWLVKYCQGDTGYQWLDLSPEDMDEGGNPPWTLEDIRALTDDWEDAKRILRPLKRFIEWIDARPAERLPLVLAALTGDKAVREKLSAPVKAKTLIEVLA